MSVDEWMAREMSHTHMHAHTWILFSLKKEGNSITFNNMDEPEPGGHYYKWRIIYNNKHIFYIYIYNTYYKCQTKTNTA